MVRPEVSDFARRLQAPSEPHSVRRAFSAAPGASDGAFYFDVQPYGALRRFTV